MKEAYAWIAFGAFGLSMIGSVASYLWSDAYLRWPVLFAVIAFAFMVPLIVLPPFRAVLAAFNTDSGPVETA